MSAYAIVNFAINGINLVLLCCFALLSFFVLRKWTTRLIVLAIIISGVGKSAYGIANSLAEIGALAPGGYLTWGGGGEKACPLKLLGPELC